MQGDPRSSGGLWQYGASGSCIRSHCSDRDLQHCQTVTKQILERRAMRLEYATIGWNGTEMLISIGLGIAARSLALTRS